MDLLDIFDRYINQIDIIYEINKEENEFKIFGSEFVKNNKKFLMLIDNKINEIKENYIINDKRKDLKILLFKDKTINDMNYIFYGCGKLSSLPDISKWNTNKVTNMSCMFYDCSSLSYLQDISEWNIININDINSLFNGCKS